MALVLALGGAACEDGPSRVTLPLQPGAAPDDAPGSSPFVAGDDKDFGDRAADDDVGRAKFCAETEESELTQEMVLQPIVPDVSAGGIPLWGDGGGALYADDLLGTRADGKFCNPGGTFANAFTWGPTNEVILLFDPDTHLVDAVIVTQQYLGAMQGSFTEADGSNVDIVVKPRERLSIAGTELDIYASRAQALNEPRSWLNPANVTKLYRMVRQTFFGAEPFPADFDCVAAQICDLIYTGANEDTPQDTVVALQDSGIQLTFTPEGYMDSIVLQPVRSAPFENGGAISFGAVDATAMSFGFQSAFRPTCALGLDTPLSWEAFQSACIASGDERAIERATYNVDTARDAVSVEFNGVNLGFMRDTAALPLFGDGERPDPADALYTIGFTRTMPAPVAEFSALALGTQYKARLEARLRAALAPDPNAPEPEPGEPPLADTHPFATFSLTVPFTADAPQRIGELITPTGSSWLPEVIAEVEALYASLTPEQAARVDSRVLSPVTLIEPFVDAVLFNFSHGESDAEGAVKAFRTTDDGRFSIGAASFRRAGVPYRLQAQYSLNFGAITFVEVSRGNSSVDRLIEQGRMLTTPYYEAADMLAPGGLLALGSSGISVEAADRQLGTLRIALSPVGGLDVSGFPLEDLTGYSRQIRGERFEFVPSHQVNLFGKDTFIVAWVRQDGTIGKLELRQFKGALELCPGLPILYGDDVQAKLVAWEKTVSPNAYRECDLVFNYSANGNVLFDITSLAGRRAFSVVDGRAITVSVWL